jgi:hypothetical protein
MYSYCYDIYFIFMFIYFYFYSECASVALSVQYAMCMRHIVICVLFG